MTLAPFDSVAADYDAAFTDHKLGRWLRMVVWGHLDAAFHPGDYVLELGCGTGEDAAHLAQRNVRVYATDGSAAMLEVARHKALLAGVGDRVSFDQLDVTTLASHTSPPVPYDGAFSNFGALNSLDDFLGFAKTLARWIRPGGLVVLVIMGPFCPWEWAWYLPRGRVRTAFRRLRRGGLARLGDDATMRVWYPSPRQVRRALAPAFRLRTLRGLGVLLPPTFARHLVDRWPRFFERLAALDASAGRAFPGTWLNDHYLMVFERRDQGAGHA